MPMMQTRRRFLTTLSLAGAAGLAPRAASAGRGGAARNDHRAPCEDPRHLRCPAVRRRGAAARRGLYRYPLCGYAAADGASEAIARGEVDFSSELMRRTLVDAIDAGEPITVLAGVHVGCFELFGNEGIRSITDLKGKSVGVQALGRARTCF